MNRIQTSIVHPIQTCPARATLLLFIMLAAMVAIACGGGDDPPEEPLVLAPEAAPASELEGGPQAIEEEAGVPSPGDSPDEPAPEAAPGGELASALQAIREETGVPAVAGAAFRTDGTFVAEAAVGSRRSGGGTPVTIDDRFQLGSEVKAMTAALVGRLQEQGRGVSFDTTLSEVFPDFAVIHPDFASVTLAQLLSHTAGIDDDVELESDEPTWTLSVQGERALIARILLAAPPAIEPGTSSRYANLGYVVVGAALEEATGTSWEELMRIELFEPLGMESCGFGAPGADGSEAPWGHDANGRAIDPTQPDTHIVRQPFFNPAGGVYCAMADWVTFLSELMRGLEGESAYLSRPTVERLFAPADAPYEGDPNAGYAMGWIVYETPFGPVYAHDGSNALWYASVWLAPGLGRGLIAVSNGAGPPAGPGMQAAQAAMGALGDLYLPEA